MKRFYCWLFGCDVQELPICIRCGEWLYEGRFIEVGKLDYLRYFAGRFRRMFPSRCSHCGKRLYFRRYAGDFCSQECHENWLPF